MKKDESDHDPLKDIKRSLSVLSLLVISCDILLLLIGTGDGCVFFLFSERCDEFLRRGFYMLFSERLSKAFFGGQTTLTLSMAHRSLLRSRLRN